MKILITNDDGIEAAGIHILAKALSINHDVTMVVPDGERSACSHSLKSMYKITYKKEAGYPYATYSCSGTPADCVKLGVFQLALNPDLVLSGINNGTNLGTDVIYSGTVSAAFEGIYLGIRSIAVSATSKASTEKLQEVADFVTNNLTRLLQLNLPATSALNINYPLKLEIKGAKITKVGIHEYFDRFAALEEGHYQLQGGSKPLPDDEKDCDIYWYSQGYIAISPIQNDRNDYITLQRIQGQF